MSFYDHALLAKDGYKNLDIDEVVLIYNKCKNSMEQIVVENGILPAKNPKNRYNSSKEMHDDLLTCLNEERVNEPRIGFKYPEHELEIAKGDLMVEESSIKKNEPKVVEDSIVEEKSHTSVILWVLCDCLPAFPIE